MSMTMITGQLGMIHPSTGTTVRRTTTASLPALTFWAKKTHDALLLGACRRGNLEQIKQALKDGANINVKNPNDRRGWTPLITAAVHEQVAVVEFLLTQKKLDMNQGDHKNRTALSNVVSRYSKPHAKIANLLLSKGADASLKDDYGKTAASYASSSGMIDKVKGLLSVGSSLSPNALLTHACESGNVALVSQAIAKGAKVNVRKGWGTPLMIACTYGHKDIVEVLLKNKANLHAEGDIRNALTTHTALSIAANKGHTDIVEILLKHGAEPAAENVHVLYLLVPRNQKSLKKAIQKLFQQYDHQLKPETRLILAASRGNIDELKKAIAQGADVNIVLPPSHTTAVLTAAANGQAETLAFLLAQGANPKGSEKNFFTPFQRAVDKGHTAVAEILLKTGQFNVDDNYRKARKLTPEMNALFDRYKKS